MVATKHVYGVIFVDVEDMMGQNVAEESAEEVGRRTFFLILRDYW
jgi:hypothetical protein